MPIVLRNGLVLTMDDRRTVLARGDVLADGETIVAVGPDLVVPEGTEEIDASGGIVLPGMIDTHRHLWQTAMRGYGADWTLTQYFVWYYLEWGKKFRPQDIHAGNLLGGVEALDAGVTTTVDWSHGLQTVDHAEAAADALEEVPGRFVLAYGNIQQALGLGALGRPAELHRPAVLERHAGPPARLRRDRRPHVPREGRLRGRPRARPAGDHPRGRLGGDQRRRHPAHVRERLHDPRDRLRPRRHAVGRLLPPDRRHRRVGLRLDRERAERRPGLSAHVAAAPPRHPGVAVDGHQRVVERRPVLRHAVHSRRRPLAGAPGGPPPVGDRDALPSAGRAGRRVGHPGRGGGAWGSRTRSAAWNPGRRRTSS